MADCLHSAGVSVWLIQTKGAVPAAKPYPVREIPRVRPHGLFSKLHVFWNILRYFFRALPAEKEVVVCIGHPLLAVGLFFRLFKSRLIFYSLESLSFSAWNRWILSKFADGVIDVEENRLARLRGQIGEGIPAIIVPNMPMPVRGDAAAGSGCGAMRGALAGEGLASPGERLVVLAGSYQKYSCLERILESLPLWDGGAVLVLMVYGLPGSVCSVPHRLAVVRPRGGGDFYAWLSDADLALLPYESEDDFNVRFCSPQKLFDCYAAGVPYVASDRPIIRKALRELPEAGVLCDFTDPAAIAGAVNAMLRRGAGDAKRGMTALHREKFNYPAQRDAILDLMGGAE